MPPYYSWGGSGVAVVASGTPTGQDGSQSGQNDVGATSTSWVAVQTCTPCPGGSSADSAPSEAASPIASAVASALGSAAASGTTEQVGITQVNSSPPQATSDAAGRGGGLVAQPSGELQLNRRGGDVTTSGNQCCFTTWTPSVVGGGGGGSATSAGASFYFWCGIWPR